MMNYKKTSFIFLLLVFLFQQSLIAQIKIEITGGKSLIRAGIKTKIKTADDKIAQIFYNALSNKNDDSIKYVERCFFDKLNKDSTPTLKINSSLYWIIKNINADKNVLEKELKDPISKDLYDFFTENKFERLKEYLVLKYNLNNQISKNTKENKKKSLFYDDLLELNAPDREEWDSIPRLMDFLPLKKGDNIIDLGCGFGYLSYRLSKIVGEKGKIYANDIDSSYINHLRKIVEKSKIKNIFPKTNVYNDVGVHDSVDVVLISKLYHDLYVLMQDKERAELLNSIKKVLKTNGYLITIENLIGNEIELNNRFVDKRLIIAQLAYWGFKFIDYKEVSIHCYVLIFKNTNEKVKEQTLYAKENPTDGSCLLNINSEKSLFHFNSGLINLNQYTEKGKEAAKLAYDFFETANNESAVKAISLYEKIIPEENFGGEYGAIQWLCETKSSSDEKRNLMFGTDLLSKSFYDKMTENNNFLIKKYLSTKYELLDTVYEFSNDFNKLRLIDDYIHALNPQREHWEKSSLIIKNMKIQTGQVIADIGCGPGYFTYKFSKSISDEGRVYAVGFDRVNLESLKNFVNEQNIKNIEVISGENYSFLFNKKADIIFMGAFYHDLYGVVIEKNQKSLINSIKDNMNKNGKLIIADYGPVEDGVLPYNGPLISKKLIEYQLNFYGFELIEDIQITPQCYLLTFKIKDHL